MDFSDKIGYKLWEYTNMIFNFKDILLDFTYMFFYKNMDNIAFYLFLIWKINS